MYVAVVIHTISYYHFPLRFVHEFGCILIKGRGVYCPHDEEEDAVFCSRGTKLGLFGRF